MQHIIDMKIGVRRGAGIGAGDGPSRKLKKNCQPVPHVHVQNIFFFMTNFNIQNTKVSILFTLSLSFAENKI